MVKEYNHRPLRIGLTGGIGSGKSTVAAILSEQGVPIIDLDQVGHRVVVPGSPGLAQLVDAFGSNILHSDGTLNRKVLAQRCFSDHEQTARLNAIMHPLIWAYEQDWLERQYSDYVIIEASVLLESGGAKRMDAMIVVLADLDSRRQRVLDRGDRNSEAFEAIVSRQVGDDERRSAADLLIHNNGTLMQLRAQVLHVDAWLQDRAG